MTLQECKEQIAQQNGFDSWKDILFDFPWSKHGRQLSDEVAELYMTTNREEHSREVYTETDMRNCYSHGERKSTYRLKNTSVILPSNYEGVDG